MHAGPPEDGYPEELTERLSRLVSTVDDAGRTAIDRGRGLVNALTDQLAAGQTETLYGLQTAARSVRDRAMDLQRLAEQLPEEIAAQVRQAVEALTESASEQIAAALDAASSRLGIVLESVQRDLTAQQEDYLRVLRDSARATGTQLSTELEQAATTVVESAARAKASQTAVRAAAVTAVEALESASASFADDAEGLTQAMTAVGESFIGRLFQVLDERDAREQHLDELLTARTEQLTQHAERRLKAVAAAVEAQLSRLEQRDLTERASTAAELHALVDRLVNEPRGRLKELRSSIKSAPLPPRTQPQPLRAEPAFTKALEQPPAKPRKAPAKKAPAKKSVAKKTTAPRKTAAKNEDT